MNDQTTSPTRRTLHVRLADAPTDVLVHLVDTGWTSSAGLANLAPEGTTNPTTKAYEALYLLRTMGLVESIDNGWQATSEGFRAVADARALAAAADDQARMLQCPHTERHIVDGSWLRCTLPSGHGGECLPSVQR